MNTPYCASMKKLIKTVVRTFYEPCHAIIVDILLENVMLSDSEFCDKMKMLSREFNKLIIKLKDDRLIKTEIKVEVKENNKQNLKMVYFFSFAEVRDIIKYKIFKMNKELEIKKKPASELFFCNLCNKSFSALDAQASMENFVFTCIFCKNELIENRIEEGKSGLDLKHMLNELNDIIVLLKEADKYDIPTLDYFQILEIKKNKEIKVQPNLETKEMTKKEVNEPKPMPSKEETDSSDFEEVNILKEKKEIVQPNNENIYLTVNNEKKLFSDITNDDLEMMNEHEYEKYFDVYSKINAN